MEIRGLQKSETREVEEFFAKDKQVLPRCHINEIQSASENMSGMARVIRGHMFTAYENIAFGMNAIFHIHLQNGSFCQMQRSQSITC